MTDVLKNIDNKSIIICLTNNILQYVSRFTKNAIHIQQLISDPKIISFEQRSDKILDCLRSSDILCSRSLYGKIVDQIEDELINNYTGLTLSNVANKYKKEHHENDIINYLQKNTHNILDKKNDNFIILDYRNQFSKLLVDTKNLSHCTVYQIHSSVIKAEYIWHFCETIQHIFDCIIELVDNWDHAYIVINSSHIANLFKLYIAAIALNINIYIINYYESILFDLECIIHIDQNANELSIAHISTVHVFTTSTFHTDHKIITHIRPFHEEKTKDIPVGFGELPKLLTANDIALLSNNPYVFYLNKILKLRPKYDDCLAALSEIHPTDYAIQLLQDRDILLYLRYKEYAQKIKLRLKNMPDYEAHINTECTININETPYTISIHLPIRHIIPLHDIVYIFKNKNPKILATIASIVLKDTENGITCYTWHHTKTHDMKKIVMNKEDIESCYNEIIETIETIITTGTFVMKSNDNMVF